MTETPAGMPVVQWIAGLYDSRGDRWVFRYEKPWTVVKIGPAGSEHTNVIMLDSYGLRPGDVTDKWLAERAHEWITDRDADIASGMYL